MPATTDSSCTIYLPVLDGYAIYCIKFKPFSIKIIQEKAKGGMYEKINLIMVCLVVLSLVLGASFVQAADLTGTWNLAVKSPGGTGNPCLFVEAGR